MLPYQYKDSSQIDKTVSWPYLSDRNPYAYKNSLNIETGPGFEPLCFRILTTGGDFDNGSYIPEACKVLITEVLYS